MDPRRDYPNFTDAALDFFIRRFPSHPDHAAAVAEVHRRRRTGTRKVELAIGNAARADKAVLIGVLGGILILALLILFFLLLIMMASHKKPISRSEPSIPVRKLSTSSSKDLSDGRPSLEVSRQLHRGEN